MLPCFIVDGSRNATTPDDIDNQGAAFLAKEAPEYRTGFSICFAFVSISILASCLYFVHVFWLNHQRNRDPESEEELSAEAKEELGDLNPDYRYLL